MTLLRQLFDIKIVELSYGYQILTNCIRAGAQRHRSVFAQSARRMRVGQGRANHRAGTHAVGWAGARGGGGDTRCAGARDGHGGCDGVCDFGAMQSLRAHAAVRTRFDRGTGGEGGGGVSGSESAGGGAGCGKIARRRRRGGGIAARA